MQNRFFYFFILFVLCITITSSTSNSYAILGVVADTDSTGTSIEDQLKAKNIPYTIDLSFTARSFLPVMCLPQQEINAYWPPKKGVKIPADGQDCPFSDDIAAGKIKGHPDFEIGANINLIKDGYRWL